MSLAMIHGDKGLQESVRKVRFELEQRLKGQEWVIEKVLVAFLGGGHLLLEGPPGVGKTSLARALSEVFEGSFHRMQMTSDLLPSEIVGILRPTRNGKDFEFRPGPIFGNFVLADELNRTSPKTQAALLEAMAEGTVTVDGHCYPLPNPFFVVATQNPFEYHGVYPLVESQLDRFMLQVKVGLPDAEQEMRIYENGHSGTATASRVGDTKREGGTVIRIEHVKNIREEISRVHVSKPVLKYVHDLISQTRSHASVEAGVSVRGGLLFIQALRAAAYIRGRDYVNPDDVADFAVPALAHRVRLGEGFSDWESKKKVIYDILEKAKKPA